MITAPSPTILWALGAIFVALVIGSVTRLIALRRADDEKRRKRLASLRTWWILAIVWGVSLLAGRIGVCVLLAGAGIVAFREYAVLLGVWKTERPAILAAFGIAVANYLVILFDQTDAFLVFVPLVGLATLTLVQLLRGKSEGYIRTTGGLYLGMMILFYGISHAAALFILPVSLAGPAGPAGWFLFLLVLTESNDIFQAIVGRAFGGHKRHRIAPVISPNKTWEGFFGGTLVTIGLALLLAPWLTALEVGAGPGWAGGVLAGAVIAVAGFFGDINMSAIKRDSGVKDSSTLLPGMGGLIDRVDSLTFTAPAFFYFLLWWMS